MLDLTLVPDGSMGSGRLWLDITPGLCLHGVFICVYPVSVGPLVEGSEGWRRKLFIMKHEMPFTTCMEFAGSDEKWPSLGQNAYLESEQLTIGGGSFTAQVQKDKKHLANLGCKVNREFVACASHFRNHSGG